MSSETDRVMEKQEGRSRATRRLIYAGVLLVVSFILYYMSGGGPTGLLFGALAAFVNLAWIILLLAAAYGFIRYR